MPEQEGAMKESTPPVETEAPTLPETTEHKKKGAAEGGLLSEENLYKTCSI